MGYFWNIVAIVKTLIQLTKHHNLNDEQFRAKFIRSGAEDIVFRLWYIPFGTLYFYKDYVSSYKKYQEDFPNSDILDYLRYKSYKDIK